ncbi:MAG: hypothetical protein RLZZ140_184 [Pseudomonadota bacterium]
MRGDFISDRYKRLRSDRAIDIDPGTEPNKSITSPTQQGIAGLDVTENSPGDEARNLNTGQSPALRIFNDDRITLILLRCFVDRCIQKRAETRRGNSEPRSPDRQLVTDSNEH